MSLAHAGVVLLLKAKGFALEHYKIEKVKLLCMNSNTLEITHSLTSPLLLPDKVTVSRT